MSTEKSLGVEMARAEVVSADLVALPPVFHFKSDGMEFNGAGEVPTFEVCAEALQKIQDIAGAIRYNRGDMIRFIEEHHPAKASQVIDAGLLDEKEASADRFVSEHVSRKMRRLAPSWEHAKAVAALPPAEQEKYLQRALDESWLPSKLKAAATTAEVGPAKTRYLLIVDAGTEAKQDALQKRLEVEGFTVTAKTGIKREKKEKPAKVEKKAAARKAPEEAKQAASGRKGKKKAAKPAATKKGKKKR